MNLFDQLSPDWPQLDALLDQLLALPPAERRAWLDALDPALQHHRPVLQRLLLAQADIETGQFLQALPPLQLPAALSGDGAATPVPGDVVGPWRLIDELGQGGMGSVWRAERVDGHLRRPVALKLPRGAWRAGVAERLQRERDILASLDHPHIARLYDADVDAQGRPWLALELVQGQPIDQAAQARQLGLAQRLQLLRQVCDAVAHAHGRLVIHRDLKPSNILVTAEGQVRLLDFGIATLLDGDHADPSALTRQVGRAMTLDYASPEQVRGDSLSTATDVYSLGVVAYELLAGQRPYRLRHGGQATLEQAITDIEAPLASQQATDPQRRKALRGDLDAILNKALKKNPADRYASVAALADDIDRHRQGLPVLARPDGRLYRARRFVRRHGVAVGATAAVALALLAGTVVSLQQAQRAQQQARRALAVQAFLSDIFRSNTDAQPDPQKARNTTARQLLDIGARRIDDNLRQDPEGQAEVLALLGDMYYDLGLDEQAADLYRRRVVALESALGPDHPQVAEALAVYGKQLSGLGAEAEQAQAQALQRAGRILDRAGHTHTRERAVLLDAQAAAADDRSPQARAYAEQAVSIFRQVAPGSEDLARALSRLGMTCRNGGEDDAAEAALAEAGALLQAQARPSVSAIVTNGVTLALVQTQRLRLREAEQTYRDTLALSLQRNGQHHADTLHVQSRLGLFLHRAGRRAEAWPLLDSAWASVQGHPEQLTPSSMRVVRANRVQALLAEGAYGDARALVDGLVAEWARLAQGSAPSYVVALRLQAEQRAGQGDLAGAQAALALAWQRLAALPDDTRRQEAPGLALSAAQLQLQAGRPDAALQALQAEPTLVAPSAGTASALRDAARAAAVQASALLALGRNDEALTVARAALARLQASPLRDTPALQADLLLPMGQALQRQGQPVEACSMLGQALQLRTRALGDASALLAPVRRAAAGCA